MGEATMTDASHLISAVESRIKDVRTRSQDLSFNELFNMYRENDLQIRPEYQRLFRWDRGKESRFIESLLLEMPVPPIFVIEDSLGRYELIDGLQRMSTYLHFRGELEAPQVSVKRRPASSATCTCRVTILNCPRCSRAAAQPSVRARREA